MKDGSVPLACTAPLPDVPKADARLRELPDGAIGLSDSDVEAVAALAVVISREPPFPQVTEPAVTPPAAREALI